jgi:hypothetical protein
MMKMHAPFASEELSQFVSFKMRVALSPSTSNFYGEGTEDMKGYDEI